MNSVAFGRYIPTNSWLHKIDPRIKVISMLLLLIAVFIPSGVIGYAGLFILLSFAILTSKLGFKTILKSLKPMMIMMLFLLVVNSLSIKTGYVLITLKTFRIYSDAIFQTAYILVRLLLMIMTTTLLTATTKPLDMTLALEDLLKPFGKLKLPYHEIALMISIALRFIPTLIEETDRIMKAQASRGVDFQEGPLKEKIGGIVSLIVPLFVSAFARAEELADAMEARGYYPGKERTRYRQLKIGYQDIILLVGVVVILIGSIVLWLL